jgi:hypothetical protein
MKLVRTHYFKLLPEETALLRSICLRRGCSLSDGLRMGLLVLAVHQGYDAEVRQALEARTGHLTQVAEIWARGSRS